ncbi:class I SAM-dependent methyltransferase [Ureibacillus chungkukjangi]|uniref:class I SAM-dependent methyltransferase n=1 Tax=Ureibacillus chungkukjangi TaxID=1202712 RepID=UPI000D3711D2|nr:class I SAM-dependent methyltransferase [Ureibacillus chungkukjangi]MCM3387859.1 class I SAM-dependent methyltransferase [Ureibacillus chungkukjangi]
MKETIHNFEELLEMLDSLLRDPTDFWDSFYSKRNKSIPFFVNFPDENLVECFEKEIFQQGDVLELGCGPGRNAIYFAHKGCHVDAVDISKESIKWAEERAFEQNVKVNFIHENIFDLDIVESSYDIVYDSGCFHHIAPHRRIGYLELVKKALKPNGYFAISCFEQGGAVGGSAISDWEVYRLRSLQGGLGYTEERLRSIFQDFKEIEIRKMKIVEQPDKVFGISGLLVGLFQYQKNNYFEMKGG